MLDEQSDARCRKLINELAEKYQSVSFQPHVTLAGIPDWPDQKLKKAINNIAKNISAVELFGTAAQCKSFAYQKLTLGLKKEDYLKELHQAIDEVFEGDYSKRDYPHISFLYSTLDCKKVRQELKRIDADQPQRIIGNRIALVHCKGTPGEWRVLYRCKLKESKV